MTVPAFLAFAETVAEGLEFLSSGRPFGPGMMASSSKQSAAPRNQRGE